MADPVILALDTATVTGWAVGRPGAEPMFGARDFAGPGGTGEVLDKFRLWLLEMCRVHRVGLIVFESAYIPRPSKKKPLLMNAKTIELLFALTGQVQAVAWGLRTECLQATTMEIFGFFVAKGRVPPRAEKKAAIIARARQFGWDAVTDDEADALALWAMAENTVNPRASSARGDGALFLPPEQPAEVKPKATRRKAKEAPQPEPALF